MNSVAKRSIFSLLALVLCFFTTACGRALIDDGSTDLDAPAFATQYFDTPVTQMQGLEGFAHGWSNNDKNSKFGSICFESDSEPKLKDAESYKPGGDLIFLSDHFYSNFERKANPLFHTSDVDCIVMPESPQAIQRVLMHNRKTNMYFFSRGGMISMITTQVIPDATEMKSPEDYYVRGMSQKVAHHPDKAISDFTKAIESIPDCANAYYYRGVLNMRKHPELAEPDLLKAAELSPNSGLVHESLMAFYRVQLKPDLVRKEAEAWSRSNPGNAETINSIRDRLCAEIEQTRIKKVP